MSCVLAGRHNRNMNSAAVMPILLLRTLTYSNA
jgi:hypothetical protein